MTRYRVLNGIAADDLIADWSKYCAANGMKLGVPADERHHAVLMIAERREARLYIEHPAGATSDETLEQYLTDYLRRHPQDSVEDVDFTTVWAQGHSTAERSGNSTSNFIKWVNICCK